MRVFCVICITVFTFFVFVIVVIFIFIVFVPTMLSRLIPLLLDSSLKIFQHPLCKARSLYCSVESFHAILPHCLFRMPEKGAGFCWNKVKSALKEALDAVHVSIKVHLGIL